MNVPFLDLSVQHAEVKNELLDAVHRTIESGRFILGPEVEKFEREFANYIGVEHCVGVNNGTSALHMALLACDIGPGDEVITTPHTWISTSWAITYCGAKPVFVDIDPDGFGLDPSRIEEMITPRTKAILPVHLYGRAALIDDLEILAKKHGLRLIEDAAQAHGAKVRDRRVGSIGDVGCFSFYPGKNLGAIGEAGAITTNDASIAERVRTLRDHAQARRHHHVEIGFNTRMEGVQAAALTVKLQRLDAWNQSRCETATAYNRAFASMPHIRLPRSCDQESNVWHLYVIEIESGYRDQVLEHLVASGVGAAVHYPVPVPFQPAYRHLGYEEGDFPVAERVMSSCLSLPMFPGMTNAQIETVIESLREAINAVFAPSKQVNQRA